MNPLVAAANDYNAYARSYASVVQLHILTEVKRSTVYAIALSVHSFSKIKINDHPVDLKFNS